MAETKIDDIVKPEPIFRDYMVQRTAEKSRLIQSGMVERNDTFDEFASGKGSKFELPFWQDATGDDEILDDGEALTPSAITAEKESAVKHYRGKAWGVNDLAAALAGSDPMDAVLNRVAQYWQRTLQRNILIPSLRGIFDGPLKDTHVKDISTEDGDSAESDNLINSDAILETVELLGDSWDQITAMVVHSKVYFRMVKQNLIEFEPLSEQGIQIPRFLGREVIVDDSVHTESGDTSGTKYHSYLFGNGAIAYGEGGAPSLPDNEAVETDRDRLAGTDYLITRRHVIFHPRGVRFTGSPSGVSPDKDEMTDGSNWSKSFEDKNIALLSLVSNG